MNDPSLISAAELFRQWSGSAAGSIYPLPASGSDRKYYRAATGEASVIIAVNADPEENESFFYLTKHFHDLKLPVPQLLFISKDRQTYILEDLGDISLFHIIGQIAGQAGQEDVLRHHYQQVITHLHAFQHKGAQGLDFSRCYPVPAFDRQAILWDLNYFKYYFLRLSGLTINEARLQQGFEHLADLLLEQPQGYFMYRDFQSRNIMVRDGSYYFIDYQGGRSGPLSYDLASLLFNTRADLTPAFREEMLAYYCELSPEFSGTNAATFRSGFYAMALARVLQAMGAYGFRGFFERKELFLSGIPYGLRNLEWLLNHADIPLDPYLAEILGRMAASPELLALAPAQAPLEVSINSFSYKYGIPSDLSGHGGGFVFDCRALPNPGRDPDFAHLTGRDEAVVQYLAGLPEVEEFIENCSQLVMASVKRYQSRGFGNLSVSFGCTGGQHRSVYCAERLAKLLRQEEAVVVRLHHLQQGISQV